MHFDLSKPQKLLQQSAREFCKRECNSEKLRAMMDCAGAFDQQLWGAIADQGWLGLHLPEQLDGLGLGLVELAVVAEEMGRACVPGPWLSTTWATTVLSEIAASHSDHSDAAAAIASIASGDAVATVACLEQFAAWGCAPEHMETTLCAKGRTLNGLKELVYHADQAKHVLVTALHESELALVLIEPNTAGVETLETQNSDLTRRTYSCRFTDVVISESQLLTTGRSAEEIWQSAGRKSLIAICAESVGLMQWMLESTVEYAKTRKQFDKPIGAFQAVQSKCADMLMLTESARSATWYAAWALDNTSPDSSRSVAIAKAYVSDAVQQVSNMALQVHGGIGFTWEHDLQLYYRRARANAYFLGDATHHREQLAKLILN